MPLKEPSASRSLTQTFDLAAGIPWFRCINHGFDWPLNARLDLSLWILETLRLSIVPSPLLTSIVLPTCEDWIQEEPENAEAHLRLGKVNPSIARQEFTLALALAPENEEARGRLSPATRHGNPSDRLGIFAPLPDIAKSSR